MFHRVMRTTLSSSKRQEMSVNKSCGTHELYSLLSNELQQQQMAAPTHSTGRAAGCHSTDDLVKTPAASLHLVRERARAQVVTCSNVGNTLVH